MATGQETIAGSDVVKDVLLAKIPDDLTELFAGKTAAATTTTEVVAARDGESSLLAKLTAIEAEIAKHNKAINKNGDYTLTADDLDYNYTFYPVYGFGPTYTLPAPTNTQVVVSFLAGSEAVSILASSGVITYGPSTTGNKLTLSANSACTLKHNGSYWVVSAAVGTITMTTV